MPRLKFCLNNAAKKLTFLKENKIKSISRFSFMKYQLHLLLQIFVIEEKSDLYLLKKPFYR